MSFTNIGKQVGVYRMIYPYLTSKRENLTVKLHNLRITQEIFSKF